MSISTKARAVFRVGVSAMAIASTLTVAAPATSASAACSTTVWSKYNTGATIGWKLMQNAACTERWGRIVVDYQPDPTGAPLAVLVVREIYSPYGYSQQAAYNKISGIGSEGTWNTAHTTNVSGTGDRHKLCWGTASYSGGKWVAPSSWPNCSGWIS